MSRLRNALLLAVSSALLGGCATWVPSSAELVERERPSQILVQDEDGAVHRLKRPRIEAGRVIGERWGQIDAPVSVALDDVRSIRHRRVSPGRTVLFLFPAGIAVAAAFLAAGLSSS